LSRLTNAYDDSADHDDQTAYEAEFDSLRTDRKARRSRKPKARHVPKVSERQTVEQIAETAGLEGGFKTTYQPSRFETGYLLDALRGFYDQALITDVLAVVKGGKEASVYRCAAHESTGQRFIAAKVYRPRMFRQLRNDALYREGRDVLTASGNAIKPNEDRIMRALGKKTAFGQQVAHTSWLMHEYNTLGKLHALGASVPQPFAVGENAILMTYLGGEFVAAPALNDVTLEPEEARALFDEALRNIALMLAHGLVHGDLSAYNILYWEGKITLIDFPQVTDVHTNRSGYEILRRDVQRVCEYFATQGVERNATHITGRLWQKYVKTAPGWLEQDQREAEEREE
jgi:RIO kinase 1